MNILLVQPPKASRTIDGEDFQMYEPLSLEYVAAGVRDHHDVRLLDMRIDPDLEQTLAEFAPDVVGITAFTVNVLSVLEILRTVRRIFPESLTVVGGHHATVQPEDFCCASVDLIVIGEGISPFRRICEQHERKKGFNDIAGVLQVNGQSYVGDRSSAVMDIQDAPMPDRSISARYRHRYFSEYLRPLATIRTSKGCPFRCSFCALWRLVGGRYFKRDPEAIVAELKTIEEPNVFFADDETMVNVKRLGRLADLIEEEGLQKTYFFYGRSDTIVKHPELLEKWRSIGLSRLFIGIESFRDEDLVDVNKKSTIAINNEALKIMHRIGVEPYASIMVRPDFELKDFKAFQQYCKSQPLGFVTIPVLTPLPGTDFYTETKATHLTSNYDLFDMVHTILPPRLPLPKFYKAYADLVGRVLSPMQMFNFLRKYPLKDIPGLFRISSYLLNRIRNAHQDYSTPVV